MEEDPLKKLENADRKIIAEHLKGGTAEVSVSIKPGKTGEILVVLANSLQHCPARAARSDLEFAKGTKVRVSDVGSDMMYVEPVDDCYSTTSGEVVDSPYKHSTIAQKLEQTLDFRHAELEYKAAVRAADKLPLHIYKQQFKSGKVHDHLLEQTPTDHKCTQTVESTDDLERSYQELLALPFLTRVQLAGFYARHNALPEARDACEDALRIGLDELSAGNKALKSMHERASDLLLTLSDIIGPPNVEQIFENNFAKFDKNADGFIDADELHRAQLDLTVDEEAQHVIRYLLYHYFDVEKASNDEFGMEISGITRRDVKKYQKRRNADWKRMQDHGP